MEQKYLLHYCYILTDFYEKCKNNVYLFSEMWINRIGGGNDERIMCYSLFYILYYCYLDCILLVLV